MTYRYTSDEPIKRRKLTLTEEQLHELKCYYVEDYIHDLTNNELKEIVFQNMLNNLSDCSEKDVLIEVKNTFSKAYLKELIYEVTNNKSPPIADPW